MSTQRVPPGAVRASARPLVKRPERSRYKTVLSIDGGGIRGIVPVMVLRHLETSIKEHIFENRTTLIPEAERSSVHTIDDFDVDLTDYFDLVAGTSIGSWIAAYIAARGHGSDEIQNDADLRRRYGVLRPGSMEAARIILREYAREVFPPRNIFTTVTRVFRPVYPSDGLLRSLERVFGDATMQDMETGCLITAYDLGRHAACSFLRGPGKGGRTYTVRTAVRECPRMSPTDSAADAPGERDPAGYRHEWQPDLGIVQDTNYRIRDIAHASAAAPTFFSPARISQLDVENAEEITLVDGGMVANNPTLQALTYAPNTFASGDIRRVAVFSVGCATTDPEESSREDPGVGWWVTSGYLLNVMQEGTAEYIQAVIDYWLYRNVGLPYGQYVRIQRRVTPGTEEAQLIRRLDDVESMPGLEDLGRRMAEKNDQFIKSFVKDFMFAPENS